MPRENSDYSTLRRVVKAVVESPRRVIGRQEKIEVDGKIRWRRIPEYVYEPPTEPTVPPDAPQQPPEPPIPPIPPVPYEGQFGVVKHDFAMFGLSRPQWLEAQGKNMTGVNGLPETVPALDWRMIPMPERWQWYWYDLLCKAAPPNTDVTNLFRKVTRSNAFKTNKAGAESGYYNAVTGENPGADPIKTGVLLTGGAWVKIVGETNNAYKCAAYDIDKAPPSLDDFDGVHQTPYIFFATTSNRANGGSLVIPLTGGPNIPCPSVNKGKDYILIAKSRVELLPDNTPPRPYVP
jgi:hypothetical protein